MSLLEQAVSQAVDRAQALAREPARTLTRDDVAKRLHATRDTLKTRLEEIRAQLRNSVEPLPTPDIAMASELQRLTATVAAAGTPAERAAAQAELDAMRERFARADVREAMQAAYNERAELVDVQKQQHKALRAERKDVEALLDRVNALDKRLETLERDTLGIAVDVDGVQLVDALERDVGVESPTPADKARDAERDVSR
jgi:DNA repair exonuclease SbcCD ATPase subunit